jgi:hypothetical protein
MTTLSAASEKDILAQRDKLRGHFEQATKLAIECSLFIAGYSSGSYYSTLTCSNKLTAALMLSRESERLIRFDAQAEISRFKETFRTLETELTSRIARETPIIVLEMREAVDQLSGRILGCCCHHLD